MIKLDPFLHQFSSENFDTANDFLSLAQSDERDALMIACSDQGSAPDDVSFALPGRFFVSQHVASSIRTAGDSNEYSAIADVEFAFSQYEIKHVIVCGHTGCGVIRNWLNNSSATDFSGMQTRFEATTLQAVNQAYPQCSGDDRIDATICEHTLFQLEHLYSHAFIRDKLASQALRIHAWIVNDATARVRSYDPIRGCFVSI